MTSASRSFGRCALGIAFLTISPSVVAAPVRHVELEWSQDDTTCLAALDLASMVERTLTRSVFHSDEPSSATVVGAVGRARRGRFEARILLRDKVGVVLAERNLVTSGACGRLDESIAVVVALMIDELEDEPAPLEVPALPPRPPPPPVAEPPRPPPSPVPRPPRAAPPELLALTLGVGAGVSTLLPRFVESFEVRGEVALRHFVPIALTVRAPQTAATELVGGAGGTFTVATGELAACPAWSISRLRLGGCAGVGAGALSGGYVGLTEGESHVEPLILLTVLPFSAVRLVGPLWARVEGGTWLPLVRDRWGFLVRNGAFEQVYRPSVVVLAAALTFELQIGS